MRPPPYLSPSPTESAERRGTPASERTLRPGRWTRIGGAIGSTSMSRFAACLFASSERSVSMFARTSRNWSGVTLEPPPAASEAQSDHCWVLSAMIPAITARSRPPTGRRASSPSLVRTWSPWSRRSRNSQTALSQSDPASMDRVLACWRRIVSTACDASGDRAEIRVGFDPVHPVLRLPGLPRDTHFLHCRGERAGTITKRGHRWGFQPRLG